MRSPWRLAAAGLAALLLLGVLLSIGRGARGGREADASWSKVAVPVDSRPTERLAPSVFRLEPSAVQRAPRVPNGAVAGRVVSSKTGEGVAGADLTFSRAGAAASVLSGPGGVFRFEPPAPGRWRLAAASASGYFPFAPEWEQSPVEMSAVPGESVEGIVVALEPAPAYRGLVVSPDGEGVAGADVRLLGAGVGERALLPLADRFSSDARGEFSFVARSGDILEARHPGFGAVRSAVDSRVLASGRAVLRLARAKSALEPLGSISGRVLDPEGTPVEGALVTARLLRAAERDDSGLHSPAQAATEGGGRFSLRDLDAGSYGLRASREGFAPARAWRVATGRTDVVLELERGGRLVGSVRDRRSGRPVTAFTVVVSGGAGSRRAYAVSSRAFVDPGGRFDMPDLPAGLAAVTVVSPSHAPSGALEIEVPALPAAPATIEVSLASGGRLHGRVVDRAGRRPVAGAAVEVEGQPAPAASVVPWPSSAVADADGQFALVGLGARLLSIRVSAPGHHARILSGLSVPDDGDLRPVTVELTPLSAGEEQRVELGGIGAALAPRGEALRVVRVWAGGGAADMGLASGDEIVAIEGRPVSEIGFQDAVQLIRGPEGSAVTLVVRREASGVVTTLTVPRRLVRS